MMQNTKTHTKRWRAGLLAGSAALSLLAACGGGAEPESAHEHEATSIQTGGRLALAEAGAPALHVFDRDSNSVQASHALLGVASAVHASPGGRYAVVFQRTQDRVQFVDGGIWQENHGDHMHDYKQGSKAVSFVLSGPRPSHYDVEAGKQAAVFLDGNAAASPVQNAGVRVISDASIAAGQTLAALDLSAPLHGMAEPVGNKLLVATRAADAVDALPTHLTHYQRNGTAYTPVAQVPARCNTMHGSYSSGSSTVTGCEEGMLLVRHVSATAVDAGRLIRTPQWVGTIAGHPLLPDQFIGFGTEGEAPGATTTRFFALDGVSGEVSPLVPEGWSTGNLRRAHGFDRSGQRFFILDGQGTLTVLQRQGSGWATLKRWSGVIPAMPSSAPWPALAANGAADELYLSDPVAKQLLVLNSKTGEVVTRHPLTFVPSAMAWLGIKR
ncbi:hypothetical protein ACG0Z6_00065 [Roseateles sp. BYS180W]|uniref:Lipoprotein n=1 Tax=Roseateles rivi TaxID=3299028 RepID=A0ABW7FQP9_9BURK